MFIVAEYAALNSLVFVCSLADCIDHYLVANPEDMLFSRQGPINNVLLFYFQTNGIFFTLALQGKINCCRCLWSLITEQHEQNE